MRVLWRSRRGIKDPRTHPLLSIHHQLQNFSTFHNQLYKLLFYRAIFQPHPSTTMHLAMKPMTVLPLALLSTAQYSGNITTENRGSCPIPLQSGDHTPFHWSPHAGSICLEIPQETYYSEQYHASLVGYAESPEAKAPLYFGACTTAECDNCTLVDVKPRTDRPGTIEKVFVCGGCRAGGTVNVELR
ncbi:hypothetical protein BJY00DRAFT_285599 [Aspergillus carlsbadensis]|nr:hypothetical protein BJY00DRAFT_285599 [Aspergillus carlsbadensis]